MYDCGLLTHLNIQIYNSFGAGALTIEVLVIILTPDHGAILKEETL